MKEWIIEFQIAKLRLRFLDSNSLFKDERIFIYKKILNEFLFGIF